MSNSKYITLSSSIPIYNKLLEHLENLLDVSHNNFCSSSEIRAAVKKGYNKLKLYYVKTDDSSVYSIATSKIFLFCLKINSFIILILYFLIFSSRF